MKIDEVTRLFNALAIRDDRVDVFTVPDVASMIYGRLPYRKLCLLSRVSKGIRPTTDDWDRSRKLSHILYRGTVHRVHNPRHVAFRAYTQHGRHSMVFTVSPEDTAFGHRIKYMGRPQGMYYFHDRDCNTTGISVWYLRHNIDAVSAIYLDGLSFDRGAVVCKLVVVRPDAAPIYMDIRCLDPIDTH